MSDWRATASRTPFAARRLALGLLLAAAACSSPLGLGGSPGLSDVAGAPDDDLVLARLDGVEITQGEVDQRIRDDLFRELAGGDSSRLFQIRSNALEAILSDRVVAAKAAAANVSPEAWIEAELEERGGVSAEDARKFYDERVQDMRGAPFEAMESRILQFLVAQKQSEIREGLLKAAKPVRLLEPPRLSVSPDGPSKGPDSAPVTIVEFSDFECPFCSRALGTIEQVLAKYPEQVRLVYRHLPLAMHARARPAAIAAACADAQGKFWPYHDLLFADRKALDDDDLASYAEKLELDSERFGACLADSATGRKVDADAAAAASVGITGTPAFLVNGILLSGAQPLEAFVKVIDAELERSGS